MKSNKNQTIRKKAFLRGFLSVFGYQMPFINDLNQLGGKSIQQALFEDSEALTTDYKRVFQNEKNALEHV